MVQAPERAISQLRLLRPSEHEALLRLGQGAPGAESEPRCAHELFAEQVRRRPEAVALAGDEQQMSYAALERAATQLAQVLRAHGVGPEKLVGLCADRSPELVVGVLAILKAGGAYLPLDAHWPVERQRVVLHDATATSCWFSRICRRRCRWANCPGWRWRCRVGQGNARSRCPVWARWSTWHT